MTKKTFDESAVRLPRALLIDEVSNRVTLLLPRSNVQLYLIVFLFLLLGGQRYFAMVVSELVLLTNKLVLLQKLLLLVDVEFA